MNVFLNFDRLRETEIPKNNRYILLRSLQGDELKNKDLIARNLKTKEQLSNLNLGVHTIYGKPVLLDSLWDFGVRALYSKNDKLEDNKLDYIVYKVEVIQGFAEEGEYSYISNLGMYYTSQFKTIKKIETKEKLIDELIKSDTQRAIKEIFWYALNEYCRKEKDEETETELEISSLTSLFRQLIIKLRSNENRNIGNSKEKGRDNTNFELPTVRELIYEHTNAIGEQIPYWCQNVDKLDRVIRYLIKEKYITIDNQLDTAKMLYKLKSSLFGDVYKSLNENDRKSFKSNLLLDY